MADIIIISALAIIVFFIVRSQLRKLRKRQCGGCCSDCCGSCNGCYDVSMKRTEN